MAEWIKYSERKPEKKGSYVIAGRSFQQQRWINFAKFYSEFPEKEAKMITHVGWEGPGFYDYYYNDDEDELYLIETVEYWLPIPELPKEDT